MGVSICKCGLPGEFLNFKSKPVHFLEGKCGISNNNILDNSISVEQITEKLLLLQRRTASYTYIGSMFKYYMNPSSVIL